MPQTAVTLQKAHSYVDTGIIDLKKLVTSEIDFDNEKDVKGAFRNYGKDQYLWKTIVNISDG